MITLSYKVYSTRQQYWSACLFVRSIPGIEDGSVFGYARRHVTFAFFRLLARLCAVRVIVHHVTPVDDRCVQQVPAR